MVWQEKITLLLKFNFLLPNCYEIAIAGIFKKHQKNAR